MKSRVTIPVLVWLLFAVVPLFGQPVPASGTLYVNAFGNVTLPPLADYIIAYSFYQLNGIKILTYQPYKCTDAVDFYGDEFALALSIPVPGDPGALCYPLLDNGLPVNFSSVQMLLQKLNNWASGAPQQVNALEEPIRSPRPSLATVQPVAPPNPTAVILDGLSGNVLEVDLTTGATVSQVSPPQTALGPMGIRPSTGTTSPEVWIANAGIQVSILNMAAQNVTANIPTPALPSSATPVGIAFTTSGNTAIEALQLPSPDASGNLGVLVIFDAVKRVVSSTFPLKYGPVQMVMAPDGLTVYLLSSGGQITYYDVLSGSADLSISTYTPGKNDGYNGVSKVFIHPDGTRLFWATGPFIESYDLTARKVTAQFNSGLPTTSASTLGLSQDGTLATLSNGQGNFVILDTQYGIVQAATTFPGPALILLGN